jgi:hypothetical protein
MATRPSLLDYEEKWARKTIGKKQQWLSGVTSADALNNYIRKIASILGVSEADIKREPGFPAGEYAEFQRRAANLADKWEAEVRRAAAEHRWAKGFYKAYTGKELTL